MFNRQTNKKGFTLLELLIVIAILATLAVIIVLVLNPAETLKKSRDVQRMSDLSTLKTAIGLILTSSSTPMLSGVPAASSKCYGGAGTDSIWYSLPSSSAITDSSLDATGEGSSPVDVQVATTTSTDGTGWIPINFDWLSGGSPISNLPIDPVNTIADLAAVSNTDLVYRYACKQSNTTFEIDAVLESQAFTVDDNKMTTDGGNNGNYYEVGTRLKILGTGTDF